MNAKFLGVHYDDNMSFKSHATFLSQRLARSAALLYQVKDLMPKFVLRNMYHAHVTSLLSYCNLIWANTYPTILLPVFKVQKRIIRIITHSEYLAHTEPLFRETKILTLEQMRVMSLALYCFKNLNLIYENNVQHGYLTRHRNRPRPLAHNTTLTERSFTYQAPKLWSDLIDQCPQDVINANSIDSFKRKLKKYLLS